LPVYKVKNLQRHVGNEQRLGNSTVFSHVQLAIFSFVKKHLILHTVPSSKMYTINICAGCERDREEWVFE
jgi:hypothetical protein